LSDVHIRYNSQTGSTLLHPCPGPVKIIFLRQDAFPGCETIGFILICPTSLIGNSRHSWRLWNKSATAAMAKEGVQFHAVASIWFEIWGLWIRVKKFNFYGTVSEISIFSGNFTQKIRFLSQIFE